MNEVGLRLTGEKILVRPPKVEEETKGGLILPDITKEREQRAQCTGIVVEIGPFAEEMPEMQDVKVGDNVFFAKYAGDAVKFLKHGVEYKVINARDVIGVLTGELDSQFKAAFTHEEADLINQVV
jgi:co-chaperonin GroES (HSP10)